MLLHPAHNEGHFSHLDAVGHETAGLLSKDFQDHARKKGLPDELVENLHVRYDSVSGEMRPGVKDPRFHDALDEWNYGTLERPPTGVVSTFLTGHETKAVEYYGASMLKHMSGGF